MAGVCGREGCKGGEMEWGNGVVKVERKEVKS
jgi:hypothetical protein